MSRFLNDKDDVVCYLIGKRDELHHKAQETADMHNEEGAKVLYAAEEQLTVLIRYFLGVRCAQ